MPLTHTVEVTVQLRGRSPTESAGFMTLRVENATAATILKWLEIPLEMLRMQATEDAQEVSDAPRR